MVKREGLVQSIRLATPILAALLTLSVSVAGAPNTTKKPDTPGWSKAKWGMTEAQVLSAFPGETERLPRPDKREGLVGSIGIKKAAVGKFQFEVAFYFGSDSQKLGQVILRWIKTSSGVVSAGSDEPPTVSDFDELERLLTTKYGAASSNRSDAKSPGNLNKSATWLLPSTTVVLNYAEERNGDLVFYITMIYKPTANKGDLERL